MDPFSVGLIVLFIMTAIFFIVFFSFIYYWHLVKVTVFVVPIIHTFEYFAVGFFAIVMISFIINYLPELIRVWGL